MADATVADATKYLTGVLGYFTAGGTALRHQCFLCLSPARQCAGAWDKVGEQD